MGNLLVVLALQVFTMSANFSVDLKGKPDTRPSTWGTAEAYDWSKETVTFKPPVGCRVEVVSVKGDLVAWPTQMGIHPALIPDGRFVGVLIGVGRTIATPDQSGDFCSLCSHDWFVYLQGVLSRQQPAIRIPLDYPEAGFILASDNKLVIRVATWLNDADVTVHLEPTLTVRYRWNCSN